MTTNCIDNNNATVIEIFSCLATEDYAHILHSITWQVYSKGETILVYHEESSDVYFIADGTVRATTYSHSGKEISYQDLSAGEMFGELSALDEGSRITGIVATTDSRIGRMSAINFINAMNKYPSVNTKVVLRLTGLIRFLCGRIYEYSALSVKERVCAEILRNARTNQTDDNMAVIKIMATHEEIANKISTHREAVTRVFNQLANDGLITKDKRVITVPDIEKLSNVILEDL